MKLKTFIEKLNQLAQSDGRIANAEICAALLNKEEGYGESDFITEVGAEWMIGGKLVLFIGNDDDCQFKLMTNCELTNKKIPETESEDQSLLPLSNMIEYNQTEGEKTYGKID